MGQQQQQQIIDGIKALVTDGFVVDAATVQYIESTHGDLSPAQVKALLEDVTDSEGEALLELIFFPDETIQIGFEPLLAHNPLNCNEVSEITRYFSSRSLITAIRFPLAGGKIVMNMPSSAMVRFIHHLNLDWQLDPRMGIVIDACFQGQRNLQIRVPLRNARIDLTPPRWTFLKYFLQNFSPAHGDFDPCLSLVLALLPQMDSGTDTYHLLAEQKKHAFQTLLQAQRFQRLLQRSNMETLMLQGLRPPPESIASLRCQMRRMDAVSRAVFGKCAYFQTPVRTTLSREELLFPYD
jgi:hypothetical protein